MGLSVNFENCQSICGICSDDSKPRGIQPQGSVGGGGGGGGERKRCRPVGPLKSIPYLICFSNRISLSFVMALNKIFLF